MTISDDMRHKLSTVTEALGKERSQHDRLKAAHDILREDYDNAKKALMAARQRIRDMERDMAQMREAIHE